MPDLNSLPPSRSTPSSPIVPRATSVAATPHEAITIAGGISRGETPSPSPRSASISLQAAAAVNAGLQHEGSRRSSSSSVSRNRQSPAAGRRRSVVLMNLQLNDPTVPAPGEMIAENTTSSFQTAGPDLVGGQYLIPSGDPHHMRNPSLGEIHQELEQEHEAQVNRLLHMIRTSQQELQQIQAERGLPQTRPVVDDSTPTSERSMSFSTHRRPSMTAANITPRSPNIAAHHRSSVDMSRGELPRLSRTPSRAATPRLAPSPRLRSTSISGEGGDSFSLGGRDESAFYQAETQMMIRENQMLRMRIRELERQVNELHVNSAITHEPATHSNLTRSQSISDENPVARGQCPAEASAKVE